MKKALKVFGKAVVLAGAIVATGYVVFSIENSRATRTSQRKQAIEQAKAKQCELTKTQSLARDLLSEFSSDFEKWNEEEGIDVSVVYNGVEYKSVEQFDKAMQK